VTIKSNLTHRVQLRLVVPLYRYFSTISGIYKHIS